MRKSFWGKFHKPFFMLAPMANVTDAAFRRIIAEEGKPDVFFTEFVSCDGLLSSGRGRLLIDLKYSEMERPIVAQIFGSKPENIAKCAELVESLGFDGLDINMGCPDRAVERQGAGAALIKTPKLAQALIRAAQGATALPVSVKTRIGYDKDETESWVEALLEAEPAVITLHARTRKEMSKVPPHWSAVARAVSLAKGSPTLIAGNGDVLDITDARAKAAETGADGIMLGKAIFGNPWLFSGKDKSELSEKEILAVLVRHAALFEKYFIPGHKSFAVMRKHFGSYVSGFDGAKELRLELMETKNSREVREVVETFLRKKKI
jgi:nifR3 family TIM-barrel protein